VEETKKEFDESIVAEEEKDIDPAVGEEPQADQTGEAQAEDAPAGDKEKKKKKSAKVLEVELEKSEAKVAELTDRYQRLMAEFENARKRNAKEQSHMYDVGAKEVLSKLLPVVDNFERGLEALSEEEKEGAFAQGIEKIYQQLMTALTEIGVTAMDAAGKEFNPDYHNAVMHTEDETMGENLVAEEFQKGYMYKDSVLRHSMVKVVN
jgi:molecular chaperone GrpE